MGENRKAINKINNINAANGNINAASMTILMAFHNVFNIFTACIIICPLSILKFTAVFINRTTDLSGFKISSRERASKAVIRIIHCRSGSLSRRGACKFFDYAKSKLDGAAHAACGDDLAFCGQALAYEPLVHHIRAVRRQQIVAKRMGGRAPTSQKPRRAQKQRTGANAKLILRIARGCEPRDEARIVPQASRRHTAGHKNRIKVA